MKGRKKKSDDVEEQEAGEEEEDLIQSFVELGRAVLCCSSIILFPRDGSVGPEILFV